LGRLRADEVTVAPGLGVSLLSVVFDAVGGREQGVPSTWRNVVRAAVPRGSEKLLYPMSAPGIAHLPDCLTLSSPLTSDPVREQLERMRDIAPGILEAELDADFDGRPPREWGPYLRSPSRFVAAYADVLAAAWKVLGPIMRRAELLVEREQQRVAMAGDAVAAAVATAAPRFRAGGTHLLLPDAFPVAVDRADRPLTLVPLLSGRAASMFSIDRSDVVWIGYPLPGLDKFLAGRAPAVHPPDPLEVLLGPVRAAILRVAGGQPLGEIGRKVGCRPGTLTYHCDLLDQAGLVLRERAGQRIILHRTSRGEAMVRLFTD
jgi:hypothetical protein